MLPNSEHRRHKRLNDRAEDSHLPARRRERVLQRFKSAEHARRSLGPFSAVGDHLRPRRHRLGAAAYRHIRAERHAIWLDATSAGGRPWPAARASYSRPWSTRRRARAAQLDSLYARAERGEEG